MDLENLETWLRKRDYRKGTIRLTLRQAKQTYAQFQANPNSAVHPATIISLKRVLAYCEDCNDAPTFVTWLREQGIDRLTGSATTTHKARKKPAVSFGDPDYQTICKACLSPERARDPEAIVLYVMARTGLRIGDVLRVQVANLEHSIEGARNRTSGVLPIEKKGGDWIRIPILGALDAWESLADHARDYDTIAGMVTEGDSDSPEAGEAAYTRVRRYLERMGKELGLNGRIHLHRLRRTVAVRALKATSGDLIGVQQLLGHKAVTSTQRYVDEIDAERVADIQRKLR